MAWVEHLRAGLARGLCVTMCMGTASATAPVASERIAHVLLFSGVDLWSNGGFVHGGLLWTRDGLERSGPIFKLLFGGGAYRYRSDITTFIGRQYLGSALPGWRFHRDRFTVDLFAGLDVQQHKTYPHDPGNRLVGIRYGIRAGGSVWYEPMQDVMLTAAFTVSSLGGSYWTRGAAGLRILDRAWFGPEALALGDRSYRQFRVGAHVTGWRIGALEWSATAGFVRDSDDRSGPYGTLSLLMRR